jgi:hypothetical protein
VCAWKRSRHDREGRMEWGWGRGAMACLLPAALKREEVTEGGMALCTYLN